ncbi:MAG: methionyl-tRNA formyltransferase [Lachnospiraceae bacterium]|nr:methionyl-tRNA formyltransferase [Lachnospiraceae bacterium]
MKIVYMGTPEFAVQALVNIIEAGHEVAAVITQPDKPQGRSKKLVFPPVKAKAIEYDIPVYQPEKVRNEETLNILKDIMPDVIVVAAYGQILPESILNLPKFGCINIHASLLPMYRGAAPIEWSIIDGQKETGVTTMYMEKGLDTGDMIDKITVPIEDDDTGETLTNKLSKAGAELIIVTLNKLIDGTITREKQDDSKSCYAKMLSKELGLVDFTKSAEELERLIRGLIPWPCAYTYIDGKSVKLYKAEVFDNNDKPGKPGEIIEVTKKFFSIACGEKALRIRSLQPEGKKQMDTASYLNGNKLEVGMMVGKGE